MFGVRSPVVGVMLAVPVRVGTLGVVAGMAVRAPVWMGTLAVVGVLGMVGMVVLMVNLLAQLGKVRLDVGLFVLVLGQPRVGGVVRVVRMGGGGSRRSGGCRWGGGRR